MLGLIQVLGCTLGLVLVNKLGCRGLLLNSLAFCSLTMTALAISIHMKWQWMSLIMLILFTFSFMSGLSNVPWVLVGELPTGKIPGKQWNINFLKFPLFFLSWGTKKFSGKPSGKIISNFPNFHSGWYSEFPCLPDQKGRTFIKLFSHSLQYLYLYGIKLNGD